MERPTAGLSQQSGEAGGSLTLEAQGSGGSSPDNDGTGRHRQTARVRQARRNGASRSEPVVEPPQAGNTGSKPGGLGPGSSRAVVEVAGGRLRVDGVPVHLEATEKACGVSVAKAAGEKLGTTPVDRS